MLSKEELSRYGTGTLTSVFLDRVYQECLTYDGEMVNAHAHTHTALGMCLQFSWKLIYFVSERLWFSFPTDVCDATCVCVSGLQDVPGLCPGSGEQKGTCSAAVHLQAAGHGEQGLPQRLHSQLLLQGEKGFDSVYLLRGNYGALQL